MIYVSNIVTAFNEETIGTKVLDKMTFWKVATTLIRAHDYSKERVPGQALIQCNDLRLVVTAGVGRKTQNPDDYVIRTYREGPKLFLKRKFAAEAESVSLIVYTKDAYLADPDVKEDERTFIDGMDHGDDPISHVLVAILASAGPPPPLTPGRFVHNLAGGNNEALLWTADEIRQKAKEIVAYYNEWTTVAD